MWRYFTFKNTYKYVDVLADLMTNYNNSYHRTIKMAPSQVNSANENEILNRVFRINDSKVRFKFKIGDKVRISKVKRTFENGYTPNWTEEVFIIYRGYSREPPVYVLKNQMQEQIYGVFYEHELQKVYMKADERYVKAIEKIIKTRKRNSRTEYIVKRLIFTPVIPKSLTRGLQM